VGILLDVILIVLGRGMDSVLYEGFPTFLYNVNILIEKMMGMIRGRP
jgi:hypothetical protein